MEVTIDFKEIDEILSFYQYKEYNLIAIMQDIQDIHRYLPKEVLEYIAKNLEVSIAKVYSVATFYENFSMKPKGKYVIRICDGTACHVRKSIPILNELRAQLNLSEQKHTTDDLLFTVETVSCLGACGLAPVLTVNDAVHPSMTKEKALQLLKQLKQLEEEVVI